MGTGFTTFDSIGGDSGAYSFRDDGATRLFIDSSGNVGIGTSEPTQKLHVYEAAAASQAYLLVQNNRSRNAAVYTKTTAGGFYAGTSIGTDTLCYQIYDDTVGERLRIDSTGNLLLATTVLTDISSSGAGNEGAYIKTDGQIGLATSNDAVGIFNRKTSTGTLFDFRYNGTSVGSIGVTSTGASIKLGGTLAANELDDYEEGTWTMGVSFGGASVGVTTSVNSGTYTKIGRQVTVNGYLILTSKGTSTGNAAITGLPFTIPNNDANYSAASLRLLNISFANQFQGIGAVNTTSVTLQEITEAGVLTSITDSDFQDTSRVIISFTYFV